MLLNRIEPNFVYENECGKLIQLVRMGWNQVNVITSIAGSRRGGHFHKINREGFFVITGKFKLILEEDNTREAYILNTGDMFVIEPYQKHYFEYIEDTVLVSLYDKGVELPHDLKDIYVE